MSSQTVSRRNPPPGAVLVALTDRGFNLALRLRPRLPDCRIHVYGPRLGLPSQADQSFDYVANHLRSLFQQYRPIIGLFSTGIIIRSLTSCLSDKHTESPVISVAEDGSCAVPLLGAHHGGLDLARAVAEITNATVASTTAGDLGDGPTLDQPPQGWRLDNPSTAKTITADLLDQKTVALVNEAGDGGWLSQSDFPFSDSSPRRIVVTHRAWPIEDDQTTAVLHPPVLAVGVGCERGADSGEVIALVGQCLDRNGLSPQAVACLCSLDIKMDEDAVHAAAAHFGVPARFFTAEQLEKEAARLLNPSETVYRETGCHGVAEGAALAAAGDNGRLLCPKNKSQRATCAVALAADPLDINKVGRPRGRLVIIGLGPGHPDWLTPEARHALAAAEDMVGYGLYLDQAAPLAPNAKRHEFNLGEERRRAETALELAAAGRRVALVSSGDAGVYGMASLVFERRHLGGRPDWNTPEISVVPGMTAMQAAAARAGAPLGHDFCAISLSDLLTPWPVIRRRLEAAAQGDFVVALYNPVSKQRQTQLAQACDILLTRRGAETPVILARSVGRSGEKLTTTTLGKLTPDDADMLTLILIGNSQTRFDKTGAVYTPRGYTDDASPDDSFAGRQDAGHEKSPVEAD